MLHLKMPPGQAIALLEERIDAMKTLTTTGDGPAYYDMVGWMSKTHSAIDQIYGAGDIHPEEIRVIGLPACSCSAGKGTLLILEIYHAKLLDYIDEIRTLMQERE